MNISDLLSSELGQTIISGIAGQTKESNSKTASILTMALPVLTQAMKRNSSTPEGAEGLKNALEDKHDGSILDNLGDLFQGGVNQDVLSDGENILGHILGGKQQNVQNSLSKQSGVSSSSIAEILKVAAPILLGAISKQKQQQNVTSASGIEGLLSGVLGSNSSSKNQSLLESFLDADGDGSIIDDVAGLLLNSGKGKGGVGGLIGKFLGK